MKYFLDLVFWNNTAKEWLTALAVALVALFFLRLVKWAVVKYVSGRQRPDRLDLYELVTTIARRTLLPFMLIFAMYAGLQVLEMPQRLLPWFFSIAMAALILQLTLWAVSLVDYLLTRSQQADVEENAARVTTLRAVSFVVKLVLAAGVLGEEAANVVKEVSHRRVRAHSGSD